MPSSVKDRFTNKWESIFFFTKNESYYFDLNAVRVKPITGTSIRGNGRTDGQQYDLEET